MVFCVEDVHLPSVQESLLALDTFFVRLLGGERTMQLFGFGCGSSVLVKVARSDVHGRSVNGTFLKGTVVAMSAQGVRCNDTVGIHLCLSADCKHGCCKQSLYNWDMSPELVLHAFKSFEVDKGGVDEIISQLGMVLPWSDKFDHLPDAHLPGTQNKSKTLDTFFVHLLGGERTMDLFRFGCVASVLVKMDRRDVHGVSRNGLFLK